LKEKMLQKKDGDTKGVGNKETSIRHAPKFNLQQQRNSHYT